MLRWCDGFEHYGALSHMTEGVGGGAAWSQVDSTRWSLSTANPATGTSHLRLTDAIADEQKARRIFGVAKQVVGFGYRFNTADLPAVESYDPSVTQLVMTDFLDVANVRHHRIGMGTDGSVYCARESSLLGRSDPCIAPGGYHHFETKTKIDNSTGYVEVRVNQVTVLNLTGQDTQNTANAAAAQVAIRHVGIAFGSSVGYSTYDVDDAFAWDDDNTDPENTVVDFVGDKGCYYLPPNADTATADFTKTGSATSYGAIDEIPPSGTDYLADATGAARTIVGVTALPGNIAEVIAFMPVGYALKEESGGVTMRLGLVSGSDETYGPDDDPSTEYAYLRPSPKTIDPATGVPWANDANPKLLIERTA